MVRTGGAVFAAGASAVLEGVNPTASSFFCISVFGFAFGFTAGAVVSTAGAVVSTAGAVVSTAAGRERSLFPLKYPC